MMTSNGFINFNINIDKINRQRTLQPVETNASTSEESNDEMHGYEGNLDGDYWLDDADTIKSKFKRFRSSGDTKY
jgi:hypothetical protein